MDELTSAQHEAVALPRRPLLVVAGAGSGKTRLITHRAARFLEEGDFQRRILVITFTRYAAREFQHRLEQLLGKRSRMIWTGTIHAVGRKILKEHGHAIGIPPKFKVIDDTKARRILKAILEDLKLPADRPMLDYVEEVIEGYKVHLCTPPELLLDDRQSEHSACSRQLLQIYELYQKALEQAGGLDLTDLVTRSVELLQAHPDVRERIGLDHILVDEFQDTDPTQVALIQLLRNGRTGLTCTGDPDQAIFGFRRAEPRIMLNFERFFPGTHTFYLSENHRSTQTIVDAAVAVISHNTARIRHPLRSTRESGLPIEVIETRDEQHEALVLCDEIEDLVEGKSFDPPLRLQEIAVLYRTNGQAEPIRAAMEERQIPCKVYRRSRTLTRKSAEEDRVQLMTIHAVKGSEFRVVFVTGFEEDLLPHYHAINSGRPDEAVEEERRLAYVAMTRAKEKLTLMHTRRRATKFGHVLVRYPSRFLEEIPEWLVEAGTATPRPRQVAVPVGMR